MQNPVLAGLIMGVIGLVLGMATSNPLTFGLLGFLFGHALVTGRKILDLQREVGHLRSSISSVQSRKETVETSGVRPQAESDKTQVEEVKDDQTSESPNNREVDALVSSTPAAALHVATPSPDALNPDPPNPDAPNPNIPDPVAPPASRTPRPPSPLTNYLTDVVNWFTSGNLFMKAGIGLLFLGVGFLLNYVAGTRFLYP